MSYRSDKGQLFTDYSNYLSGECVDQRLHSDSGFCTGPPGETPCLASTRTYFQPFGLLLAVCAALIISMTALLLYHNSASSHRPADLTGHLSSQSVFQETKAAHPARKDDSSGVLGRLFSPLVDLPALQGCLLPGD